MRLKLSEKKIDRTISPAEAFAAIMKHDAFDTVIVPADTAVDRNQYILQNNRCTGRCFLYIAVHPCMHVCVLEVYRSVCLSVCLSVRPSCLDACGGQGILPFHALLSLRSPMMQSRGHYPRTYTLTAVGEPVTHTPTHRHTHTHTHTHTRTHTHTHSHTLTHTHTHSHTHTLTQRHTRRHIHAGHMIVA